MKAYAGAFIPRLKTGAFPRLFRKCLYCYKELEEGQKDFHPGCARKFFGTSDAPLLEYRREEMALSINGKKARIQLADFLKSSDTMGIEQRVTLGLIDGLRNAMPAWIDLINDSFLSDDMKQDYLDLISRRMDVLTKS